MAQRIFMYFLVGRWHWWGDDIGEGDGLSPVVPSLGVVQVELDPRAALRMREAGVAGVERGRVDLEAPSSLS